MPRSDKREEDGDARRDPPVICDPLGTELPLTTETAPDGSWFCKKCMQKDRNTLNYPQRKKCNVCGSNRCEQGSLPFIPHKFFRQGGIDDRDI